METFGKITLHNGNCMDVLKSLPDKSFDLAIVDPPYGINAANIFGGETRKSGNGCANKTAFEKKDWDKTPPPVEYFEELFRVSKNQIIWGANHFISRIPVDSSCWVCWDKDNGTTKFADCELAWTSFDKAARLYKYTWNGMLQGNMKKKEQRIHPTQKPIALYGWLLNTFAEPGNKILDTHLGSGSICVAAHDLGFELLGIELDPIYYKAARQRLLYHQAQLGIF